MIKAAHNLLGKVDKLIVNLAGWKHIPHSKNNFMYLSPFVYRGKPLRLRDGTLISKGDFVAEVHIDNMSIKSIDTSYGNLIKLLGSELQAIKGALKEEPYSKIKAIYGVTVFYKIANRQGFTVVDMDNRFKKYFGSIWENILRLSLKNGDRKSRKKFVFSKEIWLSSSQISNMNK